MARTPIYPGEILADELDALGFNPTELSRQIRVPANRISQIINGERAITGDTALRLGHWFGTSAVFWMNLQSLYDLRQAAQHVGNGISSLPTRRNRAAASRETEVAPDRVVAQVMNIGDYDDVLLVTRQVGDDELRRVLTTAEAGQFSARSWAYWHYRLSLAAVDRVPSMPVRRIE